MTTEKKLELLAEMLEVEPEDLDPDMLLEDLDEWDSLNALNLIVLVDEEFGKTLTGDVIKNFTTIGDILDVMN